MKTPSIIGTPLSPSATKVMLLGSGELGKEVIIALQLPSVLKPSRSTAMPTRRASSRTSRACDQHGGRSGVAGIG